MTCDVGRWVPKRSVPGPPRTGGARSLPHKALATARSGEMPGVATKLLLLAGCFARPSGVRHQSRGPGHLPRPVCVTTGGTRVRQSCHALHTGQVRVLRVLGVGSHQQDKVGKPTQQHCTSPRASRKLEKPVTPRAKRLRYTVPRWVRVSACREQHDKPLVTDLKSILETLDGPCRVQKVPEALLILGQPET